MKWLERLIAGYLRRRGYRVQSREERAAEMAHWREVVEGIDRG
jgi:hypothetical protein